MADWSDSINWQRGPAWAGNVALQKPPDANAQAIKQFLARLQAQQAAQNQPRQGVYGMDRKTYTEDDARKLLEFTHPNRPPQVSSSEPQTSGGSIDRSSFNAELQDPALRQRLASLAYRETGGQGPQAQQAFVETIFNRAAARGKSLADTISGQDGYYPPVSLRPVDPARVSSYGPIVDTVARGSNLSNGATGNASGGVGFNGGQQTYAANGERFGREGPDKNWKVPYKQEANAFYDRDGADGYQRDRGMLMDNGYRDSPPMQTAQMQTPGAYRQNFGTPQQAAPQVSSWSSQQNAFSPSGWNPDGTITWADGSRTQASGLS